MQRFKSQRRVQIDESPKFDDGDEEDRETVDDGPYDNGGARLISSERSLREDQEPFMGVKVRRKTSFHREYRGDYFDVPSHPCLMRILQKQGDNQVLFADKVLKFTSSGKMKRRILLVTEVAVYVVDPDTDALKRRVALSSIEKVCLSELSDNFFAVIVPKEYDLLMASTRKTEIVTVFGEALKSASKYDLEVEFSNRFEYHAGADFVKEVQFEEVEGGVKTKIVIKK